MRHQDGRSWCHNCGKGYNSHGATRDIAKQFGVDEERAHLLCPASDAAWEEYHYKRRVATYNGARQEVIRAVEALHSHDRTVPLIEIYKLLPVKPEWSK